MEVGVSLSDISMKGTMRRLVKGRATTTHNLLQSSGLPLQADTSSHEPTAVRGDRTKTCKIPHKPSQQAGVDRHHTCSMGVCTTVNLHSRKRRSSATSEGRVQERLLQPLINDQTVRRSSKKQPTIAQVALKPRQQLQDRTRAPPWLLHTPPHRNQQLQESIETEVVAINKPPQQTTRLD
jgi:hypothetical protein